MSIQFVDADTQDLEAVELARQALSSMTHGQREAFLVGACADHFSQHAYSVIPFPTGMDDLREQDRYRDNVAAPHFSATGYVLVEKLFRYMRYRAERPITFPEIDSRTMVAKFVIWLRLTKEE